MEWQYCKACGKVVDEYEQKCYWCGAPKEELEEKARYSKDQLILSFEAN
jgi:RNA polymerase subunit RPABC4/transcription elongation factor Spt4